MKLAETDVTTMRDHGISEHSQDLGKAQVSLSQTELWRNALFLALVTWLLISSAYHGAISPGSITGIDFTIFYHAAARLNQGLALYQPQGELYTYSPLLALLLRPLARVSLEEALKIWFGFNSLCLVLSVAVYAAAARMTTRDIAPLGLMLLVGFRFWPTTMNFALGQTNFLLLLLLTGMFWADSRQKPILLGLLIGCAGLFKIWMLGLILYPLLRRHWQAAAVGTGACGAGLSALFTLVGWHEFPAFLQASLITSRQVSRISVTHSLFGFAGLHFRANALVHPIRDSLFLYGLVLLVGLAALAAGFVMVWRCRALTPFEARLSFGLVAVSVLLLLPPCQNEYLVLCLPLLWTVIAPSDAEAAPFWVPLLLGGGVIYLLFSRGWGPYAPVPLSYQQGWRSLLVSTGFFATAGLWLTAALTLRSRRPVRQLPAIPR